jgi:uncharacterized membrane protein YGL010W
VDLGGLPLSWVALALWGGGYLALDTGLALASLPMLGMVGLGASWAAGLTEPAWMWAGGGLFLVGYIAQFVGHAIEGRKPALAENFALAQYTAPLFVVAEWVKLLGLRRPLFERVQAEIARRDAG